MSNRFLVSAAVIVASLAGTAYAAHPNVDTFDGMNRRVPTRVDSAQTRDDAYSHGSVTPSNTDRYDGMAPVKPLADGRARRGSAGKPVRGERARSNTGAEGQKELR